MASAVARWLPPRDRVEGAYVAALLAAQTGQRLTEKEALKLLRLCKVRVHSHAFYPLQFTGTSAIFTESRHEVHYHVSSVEC